MVNHHGNYYVMIGITIVKWCVRNIWLIKFNTVIFKTILSLHIEIVNACSIAFPIFNDFIITTSKLLNMISTFGGGWNIWGNFFNV